MNENTKFLSYLPLAHIFDRASEEIVLYAGGEIGYWRGNVLGLIDDANAFKPTYMAGVPRVWDRVYTRAMAKISESSVKKTIYAIAAWRKRGALDAGAPPETAGGIWDTIIFKKIAAQLGGSINLVVSGGAPLAPHTEDFLRLGMCAVVGQGYGLTETCAGATLCNPREPDQVATVGIPLPGVEVRLAAVPEMGYDPMADPPRGEVLLKGPNVFQGYYKQEDKTKEVLSADGWFYTGDVGELGPSGVLNIIDRVKNIFKLAQGEYVAVEKVEAAYKKNSFIDQIWVYGNSLESSLVAIVVPLADPLLAWGGGKGTLAELCDDPDAIAHVLASLQATGKAAKLNGFEVLKAIKLVPDAFTVANDLLTPSYKLKRHELLKVYKEDVSAMYAELRTKTSKSMKNLL